MKCPTRVSVLDHIRLARLDLARRKIGDATVIKTLNRLVDAQLDALGIEKLPQTTPMAHAAAAAIRPIRKKAR